MQWKTPLPLHELAHAMEERLFRIFNLLKLYHTLNFFSTFFVLLLPDCMLFGPFLIVRILQQCAILIF